MAAKIINADPYQGLTVTLTAGSFKATGVVDEVCSIVYASLQQMPGPPPIPGTPPRITNVGEYQGWSFTFNGVVANAQYTLTVTAQSSSGTATAAIMIYTA